MCAGMMSGVWESRTKKPVSLQMMLDQGLCNEIRRGRFDHGGSFSYSHHDSKDI